MNDYFLGKCSLIVGDDPFWGISAHFWGVNDHYYRKRQKKTVLRVFMLMIAIVDGDWRGAIMLRRQMKMENKCL